MCVGKRSFAAKRWRLYIFHRQVAQIYAGKKNDDKKGGVKKFCGGGLDT
jgi:hypothetical protein